MYLYSCSTVHTWILNKIPTLLLPFYSRNSRICGQTRQSIAAISAALTGLIVPSLSVIALGFRLFEILFVGIWSDVNISNSLPSLEFLRFVVPSSIRLFSWSPICSLITGRIESYSLFSLYSGPGGQPSDRDIHHDLTEGSKNYHIHLLQD